jgi:hypothetical protein
MLKAWTHNDEGGLLILGLTFKQNFAKPRRPIRNLIKIDHAPDDVVLITADTRSVIANALELSINPIVISQDKPIWHFMRQRKTRKVLHVCMERRELLTLRQRPLASYYRLSGAAVGMSFDTLLIAGADQYEEKMVHFLKRISLIGDDSRVALDNVCLRV